MARKRHSAEGIVNKLRQAEVELGNRVERIWRREGLKVTRKQPKRGRLWLNEESCVQLRPEHKDHVWTYDFVQTRTKTGGRCGCWWSSMSTRVSA